MIGAGLAAGLILIFIRRLFAKMFSRKKEPGTSVPGALPSAGDQIEAQRKVQAELDAEMQAQFNAAALKEGTLRTEVMLKRFRDNINKDALLASHIVRSWLNENG